jgi:pimeloyl-ACP methyl ester carboxylesterase
MRIPADPSILPATAVLSEGDGPAIVLLHAFPLDRGMWASQVAALSGRYRVHAVDLFGFGGCALPAGGWGVESMADALAGWILAEKISTPVVVCGLSMGGYVALAFARRHANHLRALVLADTRAEPDAEDARAARDRAIEAVQQHGSAAQVEAMLPKVLGPTTHADRPGVVSEFRRTGLSQDREAVVAGLIALRDRPDARPGLAAVAVPTLIIVGDEDALTPPSAAESLAAGIRGAKLVVLPGAGHLSNLETPDAFNAAVLDFLDGLGPK